ncbi:hypothetical protein ERO13_A09G118450v2 [Gossypium hirsutum]|uniref:Uncharacterized protein n=1 Tax=Gossypium tomentosum TaxID=34277 RepID=A0A5D2P501_GOSTO|nr:hypothetical protein ERO13_A09G118450v2 [Gossypium hirsutum]TYI10455.1 hypothetical protein ES332_A09G142300v1 [Gossypium tomentosum]
MRVPLVAPLTPPAKETNSRQDNPYRMQLNHHHPRRERQLRLDPIMQSCGLPPLHQIRFSEENNMGNRHHLLLPAEKITMIPDAPKKCKQTISFMPRFNPLPQAAV